MSQVQNLPRCPYRVDVYPLSDNKFLISFYTDPNTPLIPSNTLVIDGQALQESFTNIQYQRPGLFDNPIDRLLDAAFRGQNYAILFAIENGNLGTRRKGFITTEVFGGPQTYYQDYPLCLELVSALELIRDYLWRPE